MSLLDDVATPVKKPTVTKNGKLSAHVADELERAVLEEFEGLLQTFLPDGADEWAAEVEAEVRLRRDLVSRRRALESLKERRRLERQADAELQQEMDEARPDVPATVWETGADYDQEADDEADWILEPFIARGCVTELIGLPKKDGGKSTWWGHGVRASLSGQLFMERPTRGGPVVVLTEENRSTFRRLLKRVGLLNHPDVHILRTNQKEIRPLGWPQRCALAVARCREVSAALLIIDTTHGVMGLAPDASDKEGAVVAAMQIVKDVASEGYAVLLVRHERKSGGSAGTAGLGSIQWLGQVDISLRIRRNERKGAPDTNRVLEGQGRFEETPETLIMDLTDDGYTADWDTAPQTDRLTEKQRKDGTTVYVMPPVETKEDLAFKRLPDVVKVVGEWDLSRTRRRKTKRGNVIEVTGPPNKEEVYAKLGDRSVALVAVRLAVEQSLVHEHPNKIDRGSEFVLRQGPWCNTERCW